MLLNHVYKIFALVLLSTVVLLFSITLFLNSGLFTYILDDPYIHLAMSESIANGHYGVNLEEVSSPSSSIVWPLLLAPFASGTLGYLAPFVFGIIFSLLTCFMFLKLCVAELSRDLEIKDFLLLGIFSALLFNVVALIFMGLETTLHIYLSSLFIFLLIQENKIGKVSCFIVLVAGLMMATRYESAAILCPSILYFWLRGHRRVAVSIAVVSCCVVFGNALYLKSQGLSFIPSSLMVKSSTLFPFDPIKAKFLAVLLNVFYPKNLLIIVALFYVWRTLKSQAKHKKSFFYVVVVAFLLQTLLGKSGVFHLNRYEAYMNVFLLMACVYLCSDWISNLFMKAKGFRKTFKLLMIAVLFNIDVVLAMGFIPSAANNIYEQQYQMHRFITQFYKGNVAVNDLGYASYKNDYYVLDLYGLASLEAFKERLNQIDAADKKSIKSLIGGNKEYKGNPDWMVKLAERKSVRLAMIYSEWFKIPNQWEKIAELKLSGRKYTAAMDTVSFYLTGDYDPEKEMQALRNFQASLPSGVELTFSK